MTEKEKEQKDHLIYEFRYGVVAELLNPFLSKAQVRKLIYEKSIREYDIPGSSKNTITARTIYNWLHRYKTHGKAGLLPKVRSDSGRTKSLTTKEQSLLIDCLEKNPEMTAVSCLKKMRQEGKITSTLSSSSLSRFILASGLTRKKRMAKKIAERNLKFEFFSPLECVQVDAMHGHKVFNKNRRVKKSILLAFIDDATRRIVYSQFITTETAIEFEAGIKHILKTHGRIGRIYTDNGPQFVSSQTKRILDILGILLIHSRVRKPAGRGKIERFFRTVRDQFLRPLDKGEVMFLADLNIRFQTWLQGEYHRTPHRGIGKQTPLDCWLSKTDLIVSMDQHIDIDKVFYHEIYRKVYKDNTFTLNGQLYEVPGVLATKKVKIQYDPHQPVKRLFVYYDGKLWGEARAVDAYANTKVRRNVDSKDYINTSLNTDPESPVHASLSASKIGDAYEQ